MSASTITGVLLSCGYAESGTNTTTCLDWNGPEVFTKAEDIVRRFYEDIYAILLRPKSEHKKCCKRTLEKIPEAVYCASCGKPLQEDPPDAEDYAESLRELATSADGSADMAEKLADRGWELFGAFNGTYAIIDAAEYAVLFPTTSTATYGVVRISVEATSRPVKSLKLSCLKGLNR